MPAPRLSATIITLNEERNLPRCLASVAFADEVVVLDSGSTDRTVEIAKCHGARVLHRRFNGFREQRGASIDACEGDWVLFMDADEWITPALAVEIRHVMSSGGEPSGYYISRRNQFLGKWIDHAWAPDRVLRLFKRGTGTLEGYEPHIHLTLHPGHTAGELVHQIHHASYSTISELIAKVNKYSSDFAAPDATDDRYSPLKMVLSPLVSMFKMLIWKRGLLDGVHGLVIAWATAHYHFLKYAKKWEKLRCPVLYRASQPAPEARAASPR